MTIDKNTKSNLTMPDCTILPVLQYIDINEAISWLCEKFDFRLRWQAGNHRAQLIYDDGVIVVTGLKNNSDLHSEKVKGIKIATHSILVRVKDVNMHFENAKLKGAEILQEPTDYFFGERQYSVLDIGGHSWTFSETIKEMLPEDWGAKS
jgi:uncharacterized glyoxalase superfamily protein PhnB